jgi:hypothetical protein
MTIGTVNAENERLKTAIRDSACDIGIAKNIVRLYLGSGPLYERLEGVRESLLESIMPKRSESND